MEEDAGPRVAAVTASSTNRVELRITGAITATLRGAGGSCRPFLNGQGAAYSASAGEVGARPALTLTVLVTNEQEWSQPTVLLQRTDTGASYAWRRQPGSGTIRPARDLGRLELDATLHNVVGKETVRVQGYIQCPTRGPEHRPDLDAGAP